MAAENLLRLPENSSTSSAAGIMRLKRLIKPPAQPVVLDSTNRRANRDIVFFSTNRVEEK